MIIRRAINWIATLAILAAVAGYGMMLMRHAATLPAFSDERAQQMIFNERPPSLDSDAPRTDKSREADKAFTNDWHRRVADLMTTKWSEHDRGRWLISFAVTVAVLLGYLTFVRRESLATLTTPQMVRAIFLLGILGLLMLHLGVWNGLLDEHDRKLIPPFADSMGIPMFGLIFTFLLLSGLSALIGIPLLARAPLPESLWNWAYDKPIRSCIVTLLFGLPVTLLALFIISGLIDGGSTIFPPAHILSGYALLSARAAVIAKLEMS